MHEDSSSSSGESTSSNCSTRSEETLTRGDLKNPPRTSSPTDKDTSSLPAKWIREGTGDASASGKDSDERYGAKDPALSKSSGGAARRRPQVRYKTQAQLIKEKLDQIKAEMQELSKQHLYLRPARKAYHPFVWNSLRPYGDTTEIDYLLAMSSNHRGRDAASLRRSESRGLSK